MSKSTGWWGTLSGILTATAAILVVGAGLTVAVRHARQAQNEPTQAPRTAAGSAANDSAPNATYSVVLPTETELRETTTTPGAFAVYKILSALLERYSPNRLALRFNMRMINNGSSGRLFDASEFRLVVDGVPQAPISPVPAEIVAPNSTKDRIVSFVIPDTTTSVGLKIGEAGEGEMPLPISLKVGSPK